MEGFLVAAERCLRDSQQLDSQSLVTAVMVPEEEVTALFQPATAPQALAVMVP